MLNRKIAALTAFNRLKKGGVISGVDDVEPENSGVNGVELRKIAALTALNLNSSGVNGVEKIAALTSLNRNHSGVNGV